MPGAIIAFDQERLPAAPSYGSPGIARNDIWLGHVVTCRCTTAGNVTFAWSFLDVPSGSAVTFTAGNTANATFIPDVTGSYRIQLVTNGGGPGNVQILICAVRYDSLGALRNRGWCLPAAGELQTEDNFGGQTRGWSAAFEYIFADIAARLGGPVAVQNPLTTFLDAGGFRITNLAAPVNPGDASTRGYVDSVAAGVPTTRQVLSGAGLSGGGNLSADRTLVVSPSADGSIVTAAGVGVGVLANDVQHGTRGGGTTHASRSLTAAGFQTATDIRNDINVKAVTPAAVGNGVADDRAAFLAAAALLTTGGKLYVPPGTYRFASATSLPALDLAPGAILDTAGVVLTLAEDPRTPVTRQIFTKTAKIKCVGMVWSVAQFGAAGDAATDDQVPFQSAMDACNRSGGGTVVIPLPASEYLIRSTVVVYSMTIVEGQTRGFGSGSIIWAQGGTGAAPTGITAFQCFRTGTGSPSRDIVFRNLTMRGPTDTFPLSAGGIAFDLSDVSLSKVEFCAIRNFDKGVMLQQLIGGGYFNEVYSCEIVSCNVGVDLGIAANATKVHGGGQIINCQTAGIRVGNTNGNQFSVCLEGNIIGIQFLNGAVMNTVGPNYTEGNNVAYQFEVGSYDNWVIQGSYAPNAAPKADTIVDLDGRNVIDTSFNVSSPTTPTRRGNGRNIILNGGFENDSNNDGFADGWLTTTPFTAAIVPSLDATQTRGGYGKSQRIQVTSATSFREMQYQAKLEPGRSYTIQVWYRTDTTGTYNFSFIGTDALGGTPVYFFSTGGVTIVNTWLLLRQSFVASATGDLFLRLQIPQGIVGNFWLDDIKIEAGRVATDFEPTPLARVPVQLGNQIAAAATIVVTEPIHIITGSTTVTTITAPTSWTGVVTFIPRGGVVTFGTGGNILNGVLAANPFQALYDGTNWTLLGDGGHSNGVVAVTGTDQTITPNGKFVSFTNGAAASIKTINPPYPGFVGSFIGNCASGALTFGGQAGSNVRGPFTPTQNKPFLMVLDPVTQYWMLSN